MLLDVNSVGKTITTSRLSLGQWKYKVFGFARGDSVGRHSQGKGTKPPFLDSKNGEAGGEGEVGMRQEVVKTRQINNNYQFIN